VVTSKAFFVKTLLVQNPCHGYVYLVATCLCVNNASSNLKDAPAENPSIFQSKHIPHEIITMKARS